MRKTIGMVVSITALCVVLSGCSTEPKKSTMRVERGEVTTAPYGYVDYCRNHPDYKECGDGAK
jgi:predicted transglutaminase-like cysteine proteinase